MGLIRYIKRRVRERRIGKSYEAIDACTQIPDLLREMTKREREIAGEVASNPPFAPDEMKEKLEAIATEYLKAEFPDVWHEFEEHIQDMGGPIGEVACVVLCEVILPKCVEHMEEELERSLQDIERLCNEGIDEELDKVNKLKKGA